MSTWETKNSVAEPAERRGWDPQDSNAEHVGSRQRVFFGSKRNGDDEQGFVFLPSPQTVQHLFLALLTWFVIAAQWHVQTFEAAQVSPDLVSSIRDPKSLHITGKMHSDESRLSGECLPLVSSPFQMTHPSKLSPGHLRSLSFSDGSM